MVIKIFDGDEDQLEDESAEIDDSNTQILMESEIDEQKKNYVWPLIVLGGMLLAHPWYMIALRVQYSGFEKKLVKNTSNRNMFQAMRTIYKFEGKFKAFYKGFVPASMFYAALHHETLYQVINGKELCDIR